MSARDMVDADDFCRYCRGSGTVRYPVAGGMSCAEDCDACRGTGRRTIRVDHPRDPEAA